MRWIAIFDDDEGRESVRKEHLRSQRLSRSIASVALIGSGESPTPRAIARMSRAQGRVAQLLNTA